MTKSDLNRYRSVLEAKQAELVRLIGNRDGIAIEKCSDPLDEVQHATERELVVRNLDRDSDLLRNVRGALRFIAEGNFGVCVRCEEDISPKRLAAVPWTPFCIRCAARAEAPTTPTRCWATPPNPVSARLPDMPPISAQNSCINHRLIQVNGIKMHIAEQGECPLIVLAHGWPELWYSWRHVLPALAAAGYHAVAPDMRGYGQTDAPSAIEDYTPICQPICSASLRPLWLNTRAQRTAAGSARGMATAGYTRQHRSISLGKTTRASPFTCRPRPAAALDIATSSHRSPNFEFNSRSRARRIENLEAAFQRAMAIPPEGRRLSVPGRDIAPGGRYAQHLVPDRMSKLVFDGAWTSCDDWRAVGLRHGCCSAIRPRRTDCGACVRTRQGTAPSLSFWQHRGAPGSFATTSTLLPAPSRTTAAMEKSISKPILLSI
jgi:RNA polymerase-binding transcription factor